ncbi:uncharacterized protein RHO25_000162 [Cercospora beticola]|uniref:Uncharacterized protein n=1 Tax=Cercospora beticola TaxID=122368 RepID=A0ABZ0N7R2_CERBT|nr:hypothetical protein RHO25_000162 [Cercospora beticola]
MGTGIAASVLGIESVVGCFVGTNEGDVVASASWKVTGAEREPLGQRLHALLWNGNAVAGSALEVLQSPAVRDQLLRFSLTSPSHLSPFFLCSKFQKDIAPARRLTRDALFASPLPLPLPSPQHVRLDLIAAAAQLGHCSTRNSVSNQSTSTRRDLRRRFRT